MENTKPAFESRNGTKSSPKLYRNLWKGRLPSYKFLSGILFLWGGGREEAISKRHGEMPQCGMSHSVTAWGLCWNLELNLQCWWALQGKNPHISILGECFNWFPVAARTVFLEKPNIAWVKQITCLAFRRERRRSHTVSIMFPFSRS